MRGKKRAPVENIPVPAVFIFALRGATAPQLPSQNAWSGGEPPRRDPTVQNAPFAPWEPGAPPRRVGEARFFLAPSKPDVRVTRLM
jgi:hypothetical protein